MLTSLISKISAALEAKLACVVTKASIQVPSKMSCVVCLAMKTWRPTPYHVPLAFISHSIYKVIRC